MSPSPFLGSAASPLLSASSPLLVGHKSPMLRALDLAPAAELDLTVSGRPSPKILPQVVPEEASSSAGSTEDATAAMLATSDQESVEEGSVETHLDGERLILRNTFLDFERREPVFSRVRALSDWSGAQARREAGLKDVTFEELTAPFMGACFGGARKYSEDVVRKTPKGKPRTPRNSQTGLTGFELPPAEVDAAVEDWSQYDQGCAWPSSQQAVVWAAVPVAVELTEPQPPAGKPAFRPKWHYGSSWPFNSAPTTLLIGNLPEELTQIDLLAVLDNLGFWGFYDFVFLPCDLHTGRHFGHAIVNLTRHSYAATLATHMNEFTDWGVGDGSVASMVKWSLPMQGLSEHVEHYRNDPAMHESVDDNMRPMIFAQGWRAQFPEPTKRLRNSRH
eukprot:gb/GFBE01015360.1/.p1 GENE.gb/GFBE01015360.1/~~gb/GFBE01015360.1/.p1  ORF type:complete len:391 (+),score=67.18 gb/GFBE01015360.1/:1-1173(+)